MGMATSACAIPIAAETGSTVREIAVTAALMLARTVPDSVAGRMQPMLTNGEGLAKAAITRVALICGLRCSFVGVLVGQAAAAGPRAAAMGSIARVIIALGPLKLSPTVPECRARALL